MASPNDSAGRIDKKAFIASNIFFLVICLLSVVSRYYIRLRVQNQLGLDDAFVLFGTGCIITAFVMIFYYIDDMYMAEAFVLGIPNMELAPTFVQDSLWFHQMILIALTLTWLSLMAVKFCYLALFKKLVDRIRPMRAYWWIVTVFNVAVAAYGATVYWVACPKIQSLQCGQGQLLSMTKKFSTSQLLLDIVGDLMILFIPIHLIWKIKIRLAQKLMLASCLCLTIVVIACAIIRIAGLRYNNTVDAVWETYWQYVAASIGLTMTSVSAFRTLFVSHQVGPKRAEWTQDFKYCRLLYISVKRALKRAFTFESWRSKTAFSKASSNKDRPSSDGDLELGSIERGNITGLRTFIREYYSTPVSASQVMQSGTIEEPDEDEETKMRSDRILAMGRNSDRNHDRTATNQGSGRHYKMLANEGSRKPTKTSSINESGRHNKIVAYDRSEKQNKMLVDEGSGKFDKVLIRPERARRSFYTKSYLPGRDACDRDAYSISTQSNGTIQQIPKTKESRPRDTRRRGRSNIPENAAKMPLESFAAPSPSTNSDFDLFRASGNTIYKTRESPHPTDNSAQWMDSRLKESIRYKTLARGVNKWPQHDDEMVLQ